MFFFVQPCVDFESRFSSRRTDQLYYNFKRLQRNALPGPRDVAEQFVLDLVPFTRTWRVVTQLDD